MHRDTLPRLVGTRQTRAVHISPGHAVHWPAQFGPPHARPRTVPAHGLVRCRLVPIGENERELRKDTKKKGEGGNLQEHVSQVPWRREVRVHSSMLLLVLLGAHPGLTLD